MYVRLAKAWIDGKGVRHPAGAIVDIDFATFVELEKDGIAERVRPANPGGPVDGGAVLPGDGGTDGSAPGGRPPGTDFGTER